jgi:ssDNA-specific exonuclease RecJ
MKINSNKSEFYVKRKEKQLCINMNIKSLNLKKMMKMRKCMSIYIYVKLEKRGIFILS